MSAASADVRTYPLLLLRRRRLIFSVPRQPLWLRWRGCSDCLLLLLLLLWWRHILWWQLLLLLLPKPLLLLLPMTLLLLLLMAATAITNGMYTVLVLLLVAKVTPACAALLLLLLSWVKPGQQSLLHTGMHQQMPNTKIRQTPGKAISHILQKSIRSKPCKILLQICSTLTGSRFDTVPRLSHSKD